MPVSGTAGLLYSDGTYVQSLPGAFHTLDPNWTSSRGPVFDFGNDQSLSLTTDKTYATAPLTIINTNTSGGIGNLFEIYNSIGGPLNVVAYFDNGGDFFSRLSATVSGHVGGTSPHQSVLLPSNYVPYMIGAWSDITGPAFLARNNAGAAGEYSFLGLAYGGAATIALDANNTQLVFGNQTVGFGQTFAGNAFFGSTGPRPSVSARLTRLRQFHRRSAFKTSSPARATPPGPTRSSTRRWGRARARPGRSSSSPRRRGLPAHRRTRFPWR